MKKIAWFVTHPIQYYSPMYVYIGNHCNMDLTVYYFSDFSVKGYKDEEFGKVIQWDIPLLEGHKYQVLDNYSKKEHGGFLSYINKSIFSSVKNGKYDLCIIHGWNTLSHFMVIVSCILTGTPFAIRGDTNFISELQRKGTKERLRKFLLKMIFDRASILFYIGEQNKKFYQSLDIKQEKLIKMPFSVDNAYFRNNRYKIDVAKEKNRFGIAEDVSVIFFSAKLVENKRLDLLIEALSMAKGKYILVVAGDGEKRDFLKKLTDDLNVNAIFLGFVNQLEIPKYYWLADIFVMPSDYEAWGLSINEAMNCECAIVVSDKVGAKDDLINEGKNGYIFKHGSADDLAEKINKLLLNKDIIERFKKGSFNIIEKYDYPSDCDALYEYFSKKVAG